MKPNTDSDEDPEKSCCGGKPPAGKSGNPARPRDSQKAASEASPSPAYTCPMHPEVVSEAPGDCPKCGMALEPAGVPAAGGGGTIYTCPMHPEIESDQPGDCPICGMPLEPKTVVAGPDEHAAAEIRDLARRFWIGLALTVPVVLIAMTKMFVEDETWLQSDVARWTEFVLATAVVLWAGGIFFVKGWRSVVTRHLNMFTLIMIGVGAAYLYSAVAVLVPGIFPASFREDGEVGLYFEAAAVITVLVLLGQLLEARARERHRC
ncbi:MAG: heavy metal-binding domain-containing protein [Verrucomicrobiales bacterium]